MNEFPDGYLFSKRKIWKLILPLIVEQVLIVLVGIVDTLMVSGLGEAAISGIALVTTYGNLVNAVITSLATGGAVVVSQMLGRNERENAGEVAWLTGIFVLMLSMICMIIGLFCKDFLLILLYGEVEEKVLYYGREYLIYIAISFPMLAVYAVGAAVCRSENKTATTMVISIVSNAVNIAGNIILIYGFHMGAGGAGLATMMSRLVAAVLVMIPLFHPGNEICLLQKGNPLGKGFAAKIWHVSLPTGVENVINQLGRIVIQRIVAVFGTVGIAANSVTNTISLFADMFGLAIGLGILTIVGNAYGAGRYEELRAYLKYLRKMTMMIMAPTSMILLLFLQPIVGWFHLSPEAEEITITVLRYYYVIIIIAWFPSWVLPNGLRAADDVNYTMAVSLGSLVMIRLFMSYLFAVVMHFGVVGVWMAMMVDWGVRGLFYELRLFSRRWKLKK